MQEWNQNDLITRVYCVPIRDIRTDSPMSRVEDAVADSRRPSDQQRVKTRRLSPRVSCQRPVASQDEEVQYQRQSSWNEARKKEDSNTAPPPMTHSSVFTRATLATPQPVIHRFAVNAHHHLLPWSRLSANCRYSLGRTQPAPNAAAGRTESHSMGPKSKVVVCARVVRREE
jgi:hypothetical protein